MERCAIGRTGMEGARVRRGAREGKTRALQSGEMRMCRKA